MPEFPTEDWFQAYVEAINASEEYAEYAATWEGDVIIQIDAEPDKGLASNVHGLLDLWHGGCRGGGIVDEQRAAAAEFAVRAPYSRWKDVIHGDLEPIKGLVQGKLRVRGDLAKILRYVKGTQELAYIAGQVDTTFPTMPRRALMRGVVFDGVDRIRVTDLPDPEIEAPGDAIVRVTRTAICGSDLHLLHGKAPMEPGEPLGHEAVGVVEAVGAAIERMQVGDRVAVAFNVACGRCWFCGNGQSALCDDDAIFGYGIFGGALPGAQSERLRVPNADINMLRLPDAVDDEAGVFVGDVLTTGFYGASLAASGQDDVVAVLGCGPVGFCTIEGLRALGAPTIYALDREPSRLALATAAGAIPVHVDERNPVTALAEVTEGRGADVVIDAVGHPSAFEGAIDMVRRGGTVVVLGVYSSETTQVQLGAYWSRALTVRFAGLTPVLTWWERATAALERGEVDPTPLISHRLPLEDAAAGYALFDRREATKVVLEP